MAVRNLYCDQPNCGQLASTFGFAQETTKTKACSEHALSMSNQGVALFDISAHQFIETEQDVTLLLQRQEFQRKGLNNISLLETRCEKDLEAAQLRLTATYAAAFEVMERCFRETQLRIQQHYEEVKRVLASKRYEMERLVEDKHYQLDSEDFVLSESLPDGPLLGLALGDCQLPVAEVLQARFQLFPTTQHLFMKDAREAIAGLAAEHAAAGRIDIAQEVSEYAEEGNAPPGRYSQSALRYREKAAKKLLFLLPMSATEAEVRAVADKYVRASQAAREACDYGKALEKAQRGSALLQKWNLESAEVHLQLGLALSHCGKWQEGDMELRQGLALQPSSLQAVQLSNALAEIYFQAGLVEETVKVCEWTLESWGTCSLPYELLYALYFDMKALFRLQQWSRGNAAADAWAAKIVADSPLSQSVFVIIRAMQHFVNEPEEREESARLYEMGLELGAERPHSLLTACSKIDLGHLYEELERLDQVEQQYVSAYQILQAHFPHSVELGKISNAIGMLYKDLVVRPAESEQYLQRAISVYSEQAPQTLEFAVSLYLLGCLYEDKMNQPVQAEVRYRQACELCTSHFPKSLCLAFCLERLGELCEGSGRDAEAVLKLETARQIYDENHHPTGGMSCTLLLQALRLGR